MDLDPTSAITIAIIFLSVAITSYFFLKKKDIYLTMIQKEQLPKGFAIITFRYPKDKKMKLKPGQSFALSIRSSEGQTLPKYHPMKITNQTLQFLVKNQAQQKQKNCCNQGSKIKYWSQIKAGSIVKASLPIPSFKYEGNGQIKAAFYDKKIVRKEVKSLAIIAEGAKISAAYNLCQAVNKQNEGRRPTINILFSEQSCPQSPLKQDFLSFQRQNPKIAHKFSDEACKNVADEQKTWSKILKKWHERLPLQAFFLICMEDSCQAILSEKVLQSLGVPQKQIVRL